MSKIYFDVVFIFFRKRNNRRLRRAAKAANTESSPAEPSYGKTLRKVNECQNLSDNRNLDKCRSRKIKRMSSQWLRVTVNQICFKTRSYLQRSVPIQPNFSVTKWHAKRWHRPARSGQSLCAKEICLLSYFDMSFSCLTIQYLYIFWFRARSFDNLFSLSWLVLAVSFHLRPGGVFNIGSGSR